MLTDALSEMKRRSGKTLMQISEECNIPKGTLNKVFSGQTKDPQYGTLRLIVHSLGFTLDDLEIFDNPETKKSPVSDTTETRVNAEQIIEAFVSAGIMPTGKDLTEEDLRFLTVMFKAIADWFAQRDKSSQ